MGNADHHNTTLLRACANVGHLISTFIEMFRNLLSGLALVCVIPVAVAFTSPCDVLPRRRCGPPPPFRPTSAVFSTPNDVGSLNEKLGGFTVKQRLREEVESPFRKVRLAFFSFSSASAAVALYFSALAALKANMGGFTDAPP